MSTRKEHVLIILMIIGFLYDTGSGHSLPLSANVGSGETNSHTLGALICLLGLAAKFGSVFGVPHINTITHQCYAIQRDINIAALLYMSRATTNAHGQTVCSGNQLPWMSIPAYSEAVVYEIERINARSDLLPNISLGFIILDHCYHDLTGLGLTSYLVRDQNETEYYPDDELVTCGGQYKRFRNVIGVVGPSDSRVAVMSVPLLSLHDIPIFIIAVSDELSDKARFPYSLRLLPPNSFQAEAMTDLLVHHNWTYVSLVYSEGSYGESGRKELQKNAKLKGICFAFIYMIPTAYSIENVEEIADKLILNLKARVVLVYTYRSIIAQLADVMIRRGHTDHFIWIGSSLFNWDRSNQEYGNLFNGAFLMKYKTDPSPEFREYYDSLTPPVIKNPWLLRIWEIENNCEWDKPAFHNQSCHQYDNTTRKTPLTGAPEMFLDTTTVFAHALHQLIEDNCPEAFLDKSKVMDCATGSLLLQYLKNISMTGFFGPIRFDENGDSLGYIWIDQYQHDNGRDVAVARFDGFTRKLDIYSDNITWPFDNQTSEAGHMPDSVCSYPCGEKQYYLQKELPCCWECRKCRENEIIVNNNTGCEQCKPLTWPDEETAHDCILITPTFVKWSDPTSIVLLCLSIVAIGLCLFTGGLFVKKHQTKIIKASSPQLMAIILAGIITALLTAVVFLMEPSTASCFVSRFGFNVSVALIFVPIVVKTIRVYRIFTAGKQGNKKLMFIGNRAQLVMVAVLLSIQLVLCIASIFLANPTPVSRMPIPTSKYVEVHCNLPLPALLTPLSFNILLSIICAAFGFVTRKLPANFNESWFIFVSVATISMLWVVFLPAYFTAFYTVNQVVILSSCLIINAVVTLVCLYWPKIYAVYFVDENNLNIQKTGGSYSVGTTADNATNSTSLKE